jgi:hypothetical protein
MISPYGAFRKIAEGAAMSLSTFNNSPPAGLFFSPDILFLGGLLKSDSSRRD